MASRGALQALRRLQEREESRSRPAHDYAGRKDPRQALKRLREREEEKERGFLDRLWHGEHEEGIFGGHAQGGAMGLEEVPGQFAEIVWSPYEKGIKPLAQAAYGAGKWAISGDPKIRRTAEGEVIEEDPEAKMAKQMAFDYAQSVVDLTSGKSIKEGYPAEGIMNLATGLFPTLKGAQAVSKLAGLSPKVTKALGTGARAAELVADPMQAGYAATKAVGRKLVKEPIKKKYGRARKSLEGEEKTPVRSQLAESVVRFFTNLPKSTATKLFDYAADANLRNKMIEGRKKPDEAYAKAQKKLKQHVRDLQEAASKAYGEAIVRLDDVQREGMLPPSESIVDIDIRSDRGRALVDEIENILSQPTAENPKGFGANLMVEVESRGGRFGRKETVSTIPYAKVMDGSEVIPDGATYNIRVKHGERAVTPKEHRKKINEEIEKTLNKKDMGAEYKGITVGNLMARMELFDNTIKSLTREERPSSALVSRMREAQATALKRTVEEAGGDLSYLAEYNRRKLELDQVGEDFGVDQLSPKTVQRSVNTKIGAAFEEPSSLNKLESMVGPELVAEITGAQAKEWLGAGLHVKAEISGVLRGLARPIAVGALGAGVAVTAGTTALMAVPLLVFYSPRATSFLLTNLDKVPRVRKAITGRTDIPIPKTKVAEMVGYVRRMNEKLENKGIGVRSLASKGMTLGQLIERLQTEEEQ